MAFFRGPSRLVGEGEEKAKGGEGGRRLVRKSVKFYFY